MGLIKIEWNTENTEGNPSVTGLRISKRIKAIGGAWDTSGFETANDMADNVALNRATATDNRVYEFKVESLCSGSDEPVLNLNGIQEGIVFACPAQSNSKTHNAITVSVVLTATDITKIRVILRKQSDDSIVETKTVVNPGTIANAIFTGLEADTGYYYSIEMYAMVNGVEVISSGAAFLNVVCGESSEYEVTTDETPDADDITVGLGNSIGAVCSSSVEVFMPDGDDDISEGIVVYVDSDLTTPVTGYSFIRAIDGRIYQLNNITGEVGDVVESTCGGLVQFINELGTGNIITTTITPKFYHITFGSLPVNGSSGLALGIHGAHSGTIQFTLTLITAAVLKLFVNDVEVDSESAPVTGVYSVSGTFTAADDVKVRLVAP